MNNFQLRDLLQGYPVTICAADQLRIERDRFVISNTDTSNGTGKHWVTFYFPSKGPDEFFDSLGKTPKDYKVAFETLLQNQYIMNCNQLQQSTSDTCGLYCVYYVINRCNGKTMNEIVKPFNVNKPSYNDHYVTYFVKKNK